MSIKILPLQKLIEVIDDIEFNNQKCVYSSCQNKPIVSHTISKNYLDKLNEDLERILTLQPTLLAVLKKQNLKYMKKVNAGKFSTFVGFCEEHDCKLFKSIDLFDGEMNNEKAVLVHYRNISYGINHIKTWISRVDYLSRQKYEKNGFTSLEDKKVATMLKSPNFKCRLQFCLNEHIQRKKQLESMIISSMFNKIDFFEFLPASLDNPVFCGRSTGMLHKNHRLFKCPGYGYMPWITYMTLLTENANHLVFCWLRKDEKLTKHMKNILLKDNFKDYIATLSWAYSDAFAVKESLYEKHRISINECIENFRMY